VPLAWIPACAGMTDKALVTILVSLLNSTGLDSGNVMRTVGSSEAQRRLPRLLEEVANGAEIVITRHGKEIARLVPTTGRVDDRRLATAVEALKRFRHGRRLGHVTIRELIEEGRL